MKSNLATWLTDNNRVFNNKNTSFINYRSCIKDPVTDANGFLLGTLEDILDCGGWCVSDDYPKFLRFSDINFCTSKGSESYLT